MLDKDIVLCDWRYWPREAYPSVDVFQDAGFKMWACVWQSPRAAKVYLDYAKKHDRGSILGVMLTSWYSTDYFMDEFDGKLKLSKDEDKDGSIAAKVKGEVEVYRLLRTSR